jgi:hypothetical protein
MYSIRRLTDGSSRGVPFSLFDLRLEVSERDGEFVVDFLIKIGWFSTVPPALAPR